MEFYFEKGYRFHPTDEELVNYYLRQKILGYDQQVSKIAELNVCDFEPWELPNHAAIPSDDLVWHFFCPLVCKYSNSGRVSRTTGAGYWKVTSKDRKVITKTSNEDIAEKKTLVFYEGRAPNGVKTNWVMHEYHPTFRLPYQRNLVICKIKRNVDDMSVPEEGESSSHMSSNYAENQSQNQNISSEDDLQLQAYLDSFLEYNERDYSLCANHPFQMQSSSSDSYSATFGYATHPFQILQQVGFRFHPTDHEIINHYMANKMNGHDFNHVVAEVVLCDHEPWELTGKSITKDNSGVCYFFCRPDYKYKSSNKVNRATRSGHWKPTGKIRSIKDKGTNIEIGTKRTLVFCSKLKEPKTARNSWIIHEYQSKTILSHQKEVFFCKLKGKLDEQVDNSALDVGEQNRGVVFGVETGVYPATINGADEELVPQLDSYDLSLGGMLDINYNNGEPSAWVTSHCHEEDYPLVPDSLFVGPEKCVYEAHITLPNNYRPQSPLIAVYYQNGSDTHLQKLATSKHGHGSFFQGNRSEVRSLDYKAHKEVSSRAIELQGKMSSTKTRDQVKEAAPNRSAVKQGFGVESEMGRRSATATCAKQDLKIKSSESVGGLGNVPFIHMETPLLVNRPSPRSVYAVNILVSLCVSIFIIGDVLAVY